MYIENQNLIPDQTPSNSFRFLRFMKRIFIFFTLLIFLIAGGAFVIGYYYQDEVKEYVIAELNKQLNTEIIVDGKNIDFTVLQNFPYASLNFNDVKAMDAIPLQKKDTLFSAGKISFQFNVLDIFKKNYQVKKIQISDVKLKLRIDENGNDNYHFWKPSADSIKNSFAFSLEDIDLNEIHVSFKGQQAKQNIEFLIKKSNLSGNFSDEKYDLETESNLFVSFIKLDNVSYLNNKNVHAKLSLNVENSIKSCKIKIGKIKIEELLFEVFGSIINNGIEPIVNFGLKGKDMNVKSVLSLIPNIYKGKINDYESDGAFYFDAIIKGAVSEQNMPQITANFGINNAEITQVNDDIRLSKVNLKGHYFNGNKNTNEPSLLSLMPFSASIEQGTIEGELSIKHLENPSFSGKVNVSLKLENLQKFMKLDTIESLNGLLGAAVSFSGEGRNISSGNYDHIATSGDLKISNVNFKLKNYTLDFTGINGDFKFDNNDLEVTTFSGNIAHSDFQLKGFFRNIIGFVLKENQNIRVDANLTSKNIDLNELLAKKESYASSGNKYKLTFSDLIDLNLNSDIEHLVFRKFDATNIKGVIKLKDKKMVVDPIVLTAMNGKITTSGLIDGSDTARILITCFSEIDRINIAKMFEEFENFGQTAVTYKNLKGVAAAKIQFACVLDSELKMDLDKLYAGVDMTIDNGELNNVEAIKSLSRFIELKDLENIRFSTLKNQIEVKNQVISIPKMEIKSNAISIVASGTHTFNNVINYKFKLSLNELLSKKAKQAKKENDEFGEVADDGLGRTNIFLSMTGTIEHPVIKYDSKSAIQNVKQDLKVEKQTLKGILKEEFGLFKKDSSLNKKTIKEDPTFIIKWEEADKKEEKKELKKTKKPEEEDF